MSTSVHCPVCYAMFQQSELSSHLIENHYLFLVLLRSFYMDDMLQTDNDIEDSYEGLSELCDMMGYVAIGTDIDIETTIIVTDKTETCPICLEDNTSSVRKINDCGHRFCAPCIEKWLSSHKTCPICKIELKTSKLSTD